MREFGKRKVKPVQKPQWFVDKKARVVEQQARQYRHLRNRALAAAAALAFIALLSLPQTRQGIVWLAGQAAPQVLAAF